jgi:vitamin-K-epoxide reductase (warfarin-sensitive)
VIVILILAVIGFCVSLYSFLIERTLKKDAGYKPICDISDRVSCTKPLLSAYSTTFGISNTIWGMIFYGTVFICGLLGWLSMVLLLSIAATMVTIWLAYILYVKIRAFCLLCTTIYIINIGLLLISFFMYIRG